MIYAAVQHASNESERSQQSAAFRIGMSDLGWCPEKVRRMLAGDAEPTTDKLAAFIGTAIGDHVEQAVLAGFPEAGVRRQVEVCTLLEGTHREYQVMGHPDLLTKNMVIDVKTVDGLDVVKRTGPDKSQQFQRHGYALGAFQSGLFNCPLEDVKVANVWLDRSARDKEAFVQMESFDPDIIREATEWLDDVVYAYLSGEQADKGPPREVCAKTCGHFSTCRALDTDVEGLLTDGEVLAAVDTYREALALEGKARKMKRTAHGVLNGVQGSTGKWMVRWVHVNPSSYTVNRQATERLDIKQIK